MVAYFVAILSRSMKNCGSSLTNIFLQRQKNYFTCFLAWQCFEADAIESRTVHNSTRGVIGSSSENEYAG